jgi:hypothetical protein
MKHRPQKYLRLEYAVSAGENIRVFVFIMSDRKKGQCPLKCITDIRPVRSLDLFEWDLRWKAGAAGAEESVHPVFQ